MPCVTRDHAPTRGAAVAAISIIGMMPGVSLRTPGAARRILRRRKGEND